MGMRMPNCELHCRLSSSNLGNGLVGCYPDVFAAEGTRLANSLFVHCGSTQRLIAAKLGPSLYSRAIHCFYALDLHLWLIHARVKQRSRKQTPGCLNQETTTS